MHFRPFATAAAFAACLGSSVAAAPMTDVFSSLFIFGDSLSDSGDTSRLPIFPTPLSEPSNTGQALFAATGAIYPPTPYFNGRFSNGPVWADHFIGAFDAVGKTARNYAFGAAQAVNEVTLPLDIPDLAVQVAQFGLDGAADAGPRPLATLFFGGNDLFGALLAGDDPFAEAVAAASAMGNAMRAIAGLGGVRDFVYFTLGDLGQTPRFNPALNPAVTMPIQAVASLATQAFNTALRAEAAALRGEGFRMIEVDAATRIAQVIADPSLVGLSEGAVPCGVQAGTLPPFDLPVYDFTLTGCDLDNVQNVFFDDVHPSAAVHAELARLAQSSITAAIPLPLPVAMLGGALVALGGLRLRRRG